MTAYIAPIRDMRFVIEELADLDGLNRLPGYEEATADVVWAVLEEAARLAEEVLAPLNKTGDQQGSRIENGQVIVADGFREAYRNFAEGGWNGLHADPEYGGQGLPSLVSSAVGEMWQGANMALALCPMLTQSAIESLESHASDAQKRTWLAKLVTGEWTGTMNLTEPQAGSDLAAVKCRAVPNGDHYLIQGQKIFITWGDHDVADNVVHLVLARTPDAPPGTKGISLFIVPKYLIDENGDVGERNDLHPVSVEHKIGIHASPTCVLSFGDKQGAVGYLVAREHQGLAYMFTMMNSARLAVGVQGIGIAERAYQQARSFARERIQGTSPDVPGRVSIIHHPDVRRMLLVMKSQVEAARALALVTLSVHDRAQRTEDPRERALAQARVDFLTPIVKGWCSEVAQEVTSLGVQVHGGMGYIEETGAAQHFRDARITTIYEGTTGIQAMDLVGRKVIRDSGAEARRLLEETREVVEALAAHGGEHDKIREALERGANDADQAIGWLLDHYANDPHAPGSVAYDLLMLFGNVCGGWQMARAALKAAEQIEAGSADAAFYEAKLLSARFYADHILPRCHSHLQAVLGGSGEVMALAAEQF